MLNRKDRQERGQAILLMAVALIGMLGFAAVALDGGNIYAEQRRAQSAADNAVIAGAYQYMQGITVTSTISNAAMANAATNDYDNNSTSNWVKFYRPPIMGAYAGNNSYMQVVITERVPTALAHLVYQGPFQLTVSAIAYAKRGGPPVDGNAIVALNPHGCSIVTAGGNGSIHTTNGGIFANSDGLGDSDDSPCTGQNTVLDGGGTNATISSDPPYGISVVATSHASDDSVEPDPGTGVESISSDPMSDLDEPNCASLTYRTQPPGNATLSPGRYYSINVGNSDTVTLSPGLYCIMKDGNNAIDLSPGAILSGTGVTLYVPLGEVNLQNGTVNLRASSTTYNPECASVPSWEAPNTSVCHYIGLLFFMGRTNTRGMTLSGQADWVVEGTIYGIETPITLIGNGDWDLTGQILSNNIAGSGNGVVTVNFDPNVIFIPPPSISLMQ